MAAGAEPKVRRTSDRISIGVCDAYFYPESQKDTMIYLGLTKDGMTVKYETEWQELTSDQTGHTPLDDVMIGEKVTVEGNILDTSLDKIAAITPQSSVEKSGGDVAAVTFGRRPGLRAAHYSGKLILHPVAAGEDTSRDVIVHRTVNTGSLELAYKLDSEWIIPVVFKGYYDDFKPEGDQLFRIGQEGTYKEIYRRVVKFWITPANPELDVNDTVVFKANAMFEDGSTNDVTDKCTWTTSEPATVSLSGTTATGLKAGSSIVRAEYIGYGNSTSVVVR